MKILNNRYKYIVFLITIVTMLNSVAYAHPESAGEWYTGIESSKDKDWILLYDSKWKAYVHNSSYSNSITYSFTSNGTNAVSAYMKDYFKEGAKLWNNAKFNASSVVSLSESTTGGRITEKQFLDSSTKTAGLFTPTNKSIIGDADEEHVHWTYATIELNAAKLPETTDATLKNKYIGTSAHEIGHAIGLTHVSSTSKLMEEI